ncbi:MAG TPA: family 1 encapsulin nanocompartment shell protein [Myxococcales bacterium LLY-WYZ-16_1]|jgi:uncharacterized linocin/CFP29 family protein|nr:family 1 encapsulin nanocompartment shell protein [Myxococcales bacterium LLY-WYZ-16_1]
MMLHLRRHEAPISKDAWDEIDAEACRVLKLNLAARKLVDFVGPLGWATSGVSLGRVQDGSPAAEAVQTRLRRVQPLAELKTRFSLLLSELEAVDRGAADPDLQPVIAAAQRLARAEDHLVFSGYEPGGIAGIGGGSVHPPLTITTDYEKYPNTVAQATNVLKRAGVDGPYGIALGPRCYAGLIQAPTQGGYPVIERLRNVLNGPIVWAPGIDGAVVASVRGGDFELHVGQDISIGYESHSDTEVHLYMIESVTFRNLAPEAGLALKYAA